MEVTRDDFRAYEDIRLSGITNMFNTRRVEELAGISQGVILSIMKNYSEYRDEYSKSAAHDNGFQAIEGVRWRGWLMSDYQCLVALFGEPILDKWDDKTDAMWVVDTEHGVATIFNYKNGKNYKGDAGLAIEDIMWWHVSTHTNAAYKEIRRQLHEFGRE